MLDEFRIFFGMFRLETERKSIYIKLIYDKEDRMAEQDETTLLHLQY